MPYVKFYRKSHCGVELDVEVASFQAEVGFNVREGDFVKLHPVLKPLKVCRVTHSFALTNRQYEPECLQVQLEGYYTPADVYVVRGVEYEFPFRPKEVADHA